MAKIAQGYITLSTIKDGATGPQGPVGPQGPTGSVGPQGPSGAEGFGYSIAIQGGIRGIAYAADGTGPDPATSTAFSVLLFKNGKTITPASCSWSANGSVAGSSTAATFTPTISKNYVSGGSSITVKVKENANSSEVIEAIPIICTKNADGLDWIADWNSGKTTIKDKAIVTPRIFAGTNSDTTGSAPMLTGVALGKDVLTGSATAVGLVGYNKNKPIFKLDTKGTFLISPDGDSGKVINGTGNGIYFDGTNLNISGSVVFRDGKQSSGSAGISSTDVINKADEANKKIDNLELGGVNLLPLRTVTLGKYLNNTGAEVANAEWFYSDYIEVNGLKNITTSGYTNLGQSPSTCYYDADKKFIKGINNNAQSLAKTMTIDSGIAFIRFSGMVKDMETLKLEKGLRATNYSPCPTDVDGEIIDASNIASSANGLAEAANEKATISESVLKDVTKVDSGATYIDGGRIYSNSITAASLNLYSGLTVTNKATGDKTFSIADNGDVELDGLLKSGNFNQSQNTGYRISPDGVAILNQAKVSGEFIMPNAGITNYGATIGNENLAMSSALIERTTWKNITNDTFGSMKTLKPNRAVEGTVLSVSYDIEYSDMIKSQTDGDVYVQGSGDVTSWSSGAWNGGPRLGSRINWGAGKSGSFSVKYQYTLNADSIKNNHWFVGFRANFIQSGNFKMTNFKVEEGKEYTPWCPNKDEQSNYTRIWAGSHYTARDNAPFRVAQNGDVWATNATLSGRLLGDYDNGRVHIRDNQITIDDTSTFMNQFGREIQSTTPLGASQEAHIVLSAGQSILNADVVFGNNSDKRIEYSNSNRLMKLTNMNVDITTSTGRTSIGYNNRNDAALNGVLTLSARLGGGEHAFKHSTGTGYAGTLFLDSYGSNGDYGDFAFIRKDLKEEVKVNIEGELSIKTKITSPKNKIEQKMEADGWAWYSA